MTDTLQRGRKKKHFLYEQIANQMCDAIRAGEFAPGDRVTSLDALSARYSVNKITAIKAIKSLVEQGVLESVPSTGTYVAQDALTLIGFDEGQEEYAVTTVRTWGVISRAMEQDATGFYHAYLNETLRKALGERRINMVLLPAGIQSRTGELVKWVKQSNLDGIVVVGEMPGSDLRAIMSTHVPTVVLDYRPLGLPVDSVSLDNVAVGYQAITHLHEQGYRHIGIMKGLSGWKVTEDRLTGAMAAFDVLGIQAACIDKGDFTREGAAPAIVRMKQQSPTLDAVFCMNDEMALGVLNVIKADGESVQDGVALIGVDDIPLAADPHIQLSSIGVPVSGMVDHAVVLLSKRVTSPALPHEGVQLQGTLVARQSTHRSQA